MRMTALKLWSPKPEIKPPHTTHLLLYIKNLCHNIIFCEKNCREKLYQYIPYCHKKVGKCKSPIASVKFVHSKSQGNMINYKWWLTTLHYLNKICPGVSEYDKNDRMDRWTPVFLCVLRLLCRSGGQKVQKTIQT